MSRWFRHYAGMMRDEKLVTAAVRSKQSVERVLWVYGAILESAAEIDDGGRYEFDCGEAAYFLRCDESDVASIVAALETSGRLSAGVVARWRDRQYESDTSTDRVRRHRAKRSGADIPEGNGDNHGGNASETLHERSVTPPETEADTDTEAKKNAREEDPEHWKVSQDILKDHLPEIDEWELEFLHSIKWKPSLTKPQKDKLQSIQSKLVAKGQGPPVLPSAKRGSPEFDAWLTYWRGQGKPTKFHEKQDAITVPSQWPPNSTQEKAA
jgi:hypothetical protein